MEKIEDGHLRHDERIRDIEKGVAGLASLPAELSKISDKLGDLIRADVRIEHLESSLAETEKKVEGLSVKFAKWTGGAVAAIAAWEYFV